MRNTNVVIFFGSSFSMWVVFSLLLCLSFGSYFAYFPGFSCDKPPWGPCLLHTWLKGWRGAAHPSHQSIIGHGERELFFLKEKPPSNCRLRLIKMTCWGNLLLSAIPYIPLFGKPLTFRVFLQIVFLLSHRLIPNRCLFFHIADLEAFMREWWCNIQSLRSGNFILEERICVILLGRETAGQVL